MSKPRLVINENSSSSYSPKYRLSWHFPDDGEIGGSVGEVEYDEASLATAGPDDMDNAVAYLAARKTPGACSDVGGLYWDSKPGASAALRIVKAELKASAGNRPLPEWAVQALAAGWKAPKGWKP